MKYKKYIGLGGMIVATVLLVLEVAFQDSLSQMQFLLLVALTLGFAILSWQFTIYGNWNKSILPALRITVIVLTVGGVIGLLKRLAN